jgi:hypothetical protein
MIEGVKAMRGAEMSAVDIANKTGLSLQIIKKIT